MTASLLHRLSAVDNLRTVWKDFWPDIKSQKSFGVDGLTSSDFKRNLDSNLHRISNDLRATTYSFQKLRGCPILKKDGISYRLICIPTIQDRFVQRAIAKLLIGKAERLGLVNDASYGFAKSADGKARGLAQARDKSIELRASHQWAYKSDISAFFDRIPRAKLHEMVVQRLQISSMSELIRSAIDCEIEESDAGVLRVAKDAGIVPGLGVRQGMPLSPLFANVILRDFDRGMLRRGYHLVRYADDFIVFANSEKECWAIDGVVRKLLAPLGLSVPELGVEKSKTVIAKPEEEIEFLGLALVKIGAGYKLQITKKQIEKIKQTLGEYRDVDYLTKSNLTLWSVERALENKIAGYKAAYLCASNKSDLEKILEEASKNILLKIYTGIFGADVVRSLTKRQSSFLGIR